MFLGLELLSKNLNVIPWLSGFQDGEEELKQELAQLMEENKHLSVSDQFHCLSAWCEAFLANPNLAAILPKKAREIIRLDIYLGFLTLYRHSYIIYKV